MTRDLNAEHALMIMAFSKQGRWSSGWLYYRLRSLCKALGISSIYLHARLFYEMEAGCARVRQWSPFRGQVSSLTKFVARLRAAGIAVGVHVMARDIDDGSLAELCRVAGFDGIVYVDGVEHRARPGMSSRQWGPIVDAEIEAMFLANLAPRPTCIMGSMPPAVSGFPTRTGQTDVYGATDVRDEFAGRRAASMPAPMSALWADSGWWPLTGNQHAPPLTPAEVEFIAIMCQLHGRAAATFQVDPSVPLHRARDIGTQLARLATIPAGALHAVHPRRPGTWGPLLREPGCDELVTAYRCALPAGAPDHVAAYCAAIGTCQRPVTMLTLWPAKGRVRLQLGSRLAPYVAAVVDMTGRDLLPRFWCDGVLTVPSRIYVRLDGVRADRARYRLQQAVRVTP